VVPVSSTLFTKTSTASVTLPSVLELNGVFHKQALSTPLKLKEFSLFSDDPMPDPNIVVVENNTSLLAYCNEAQNLFVPGQAINTRLMGMLNIRFNAPHFVYENNSQYVHVVVRDSNIPYLKSTNKTNLDKIDIYLNRYDGSVYTGRTLGSARPVKNILLQNYGGDKQPSQQFQRGADIVDGSQW